MHSHTTNFNERISVGVICLTTPQITAAPCMIDAKVSREADEMRISKFPDLGNENWSIRNQIRPIESFQASSRLHLRLCAHIELSFIAFDVN